MSISLWLRIMSAAMHIGIDLWVFLKDMRSSIENEGKTLSDIFDDSCLQVI